MARRLGLGFGINAQAKAGTPSGGRVAYGDQQFYGANGYGVYAAPWSTYSGRPNAALQRPADYQDTMRVNPATFPNGTRIESRFPTPGYGGVTGFYHLLKGNYDGSDPAGWTPWQVGNLTAFNEDVDWYRSVGNTADYLMMSEFYLTSVSGDPNTGLYEIAHWYAAEGLALLFFNSGVLIGEHTDSTGRIWEVRNTGPNPRGADYIIFLLKSRNPLFTLNADKRQALQWLITRGLSIAHLWVNGTAFGMETFQGINAVEVATYLVNFAGSGSIIPAPTGELVPDGAMNGIGAWENVNGPKQITGGVMRFTAVSEYDNVLYPVAFVTGGTYRLSFAIKAFTQGGLLPRFTGGVPRAGTVRAAVGTFTQDLVANASNNRLEFLVLSPQEDGRTTTLDLDDVSIIRLS